MARQAKKPPPAHVWPERTARERLIGNLTRLDIFGYLGDVTLRPPAVEIKLMWNLFIRIKYERGQSPFSYEHFVAFTEEETAYLLEPVGYRGFPAPRLVTLIAALFTSSVLEKAYEDKRHDYPATTFELFLIDYILYARLMLFRDAQLDPVTREWMLAPALGAPEGAPPLPKLMLAVHHCSGELNRLFAVDDRRGYLGFMFFFLHWKLRDMPGYEHPGWFAALIDAPSSAVPDAGRDGISLRIEAAYAADPQGNAMQFDLSTHAGRIGWRDWFCAHLAPEHPGYRHPQWLASVLEARERTP